MWDSDVFGFHIVGGTLALSTDPSFWRRMMVSDKCAEVAMDESTKRDPPASAIGRAARAMVIVGAAALALLLGFIGFQVGFVWLAMTRGFTAPLVSAAVLLVAVLLVAGVPAFLVFRHSRLAGRRRQVGSGLVLGTGIALVLVAAWGVRTHFDPMAMSTGQIDTEIASITSTHREAFYVGKEVDGQRLSVISAQDGLLYFEYGGCLDNVEGDCDRPLVVTSQPTSSFGSRGETSSGCRRLKSMLGVPTANLSGDLTLFTGSSIVTVTYWRAVPSGLVVDQRREYPVGAQLRPVGQSTAPKTLPPPDAATRTFLSKHCRRR